MVKINGIANKLTRRIVLIKMLMTTVPGYSGPLKFSRCHKIDLFDQHIVFEAMYELGSKDYPL
jgi:hypothetical protein